VKTAISLPNHTFERATERARELGMSRSEFFAKAAQRYLDELDSESVTRQIDVVYSLLDDVDDSAVDAVEVGRRVLIAVDDW
jgi:metal-responsive CopG/Arc/MetJ family transcriptional regulator